MTKSKKRTRIFLKLWILECCVCFSICIEKNSHFKKLFCLVKRYVFFDKKSNDLELKKMRFIAFQPPISLTLDMSITGLQFSLFLILKYNLIYLQELLSRSNEMIMKAHIKVNNVRWCMIPCILLFLW